MVVCSVAYWVTFAAQLVAMPAFGIGSAMWLSREARQHREEEMLQIQIEMSIGPSSTPQLPVDAASPAVPPSAPAEEAVLPADGPDSPLRRLVIYQGGAFLAGLIGQYLSSSALACC